MIKNEVNYRTLRQDLDTVMLRLQAEDIDIDEAIDLYKKARNLISLLEEYLSKAQNEVKKLKTE